MLHKIRDGPERDAGIARSWLGRSRPPHRKDKKTTSAKQTLLNLGLRASQSPRKI